MSIINYKNSCKYICTFAKNNKIYDQIFGILEK